MTSQRTTIETLHRSALRIALAALTLVSGQATAQPSPATRCRVPRTSGQGLPASTIRADLNGDGCPDVATFIDSVGGGTVELVSGASPNTVTTEYIADGGYPDRRYWVPDFVNGKYAYCVMMDPKFTIQCRVVASNMNFIDKVYRGATPDLGYPGTIVWFDKVHDGVKKFCRNVGDNGGHRECIDLIPDP